MPTTQPDFQAGQLVRVAEEAATQDAARNLVGSALASVAGSSSANADDVPFTVTAVGGMSVTAGGSGGQKALINSASGPRLIDAIPSQTFTVPTADPSNTRKDIIYGTYVQSQVESDPNGNFATTDGTTITTSTGPIYNALESLTYTYVTGSASSSPLDPAGPTGSVALARITVAAAETTIASGNIMILLQSIQAQVLSGVAGFVDLTSNQTAAGNKTFSGVTKIGGIQFAAGDTPFSGVAGVRLNGVGSIVISPTASGNAIYLGYDCLTLASVNFGPMNAWGFIGSAGYHSPSNTSTYGDNATIGGTASVTGILTVGGATMINSYVSSDFSVNIAQTSQQLNLTLPSSFVSSFTSSDSSVSPTRTGRTLDIILPSGYVNSFASSDSSINATTSGRGLNLTLPSGYINSFTSSDSSVNISQSGRTLTLVLPGGFANSYSSPHGTVSVGNTSRSATFDVPAGLSFRSHNRITSSGSQTLALTTLPSVSGHSWKLCAQATVDLASGSMTLTGVVGTWESTTTINDDGVSGAQTIFLLGTSVGGEAPSVTFSIPNLGGGDDGIFSITSWLQ